MPHLEHVSEAELRHFARGRAARAEAARTMASGLTVDALSQDVKIAAMLTELEGFTDWLAGANGFIGEFGWPRNADSTRWNTLANSWFAKVNDAGLWATVWASGQWWDASDLTPPGYNLLVYGNAEAGDGVDTSFAQAPTIENWRSAMNSYTIDRVTFTHAGVEGTGHITRDYRIQYRNFPTQPWQDLVVVTGNTNNTPTHFFNPIAVRQLRIYVEDPSTIDNATRIYSCEVRYTGAGADQARARPVKVSGTANAATENGYHMVDGNVNTKWCDNINSPSWAIIDLVSPLDEWMRGVSDAGGEFGSLPGTLNTDYVYSGTETFEYYFNHFVRIVRIPFKWERIQPTLGAAFNATKIQELRDVVKRAGDVGLKVILDPHNYGRYNVSGTDHIIGSATVTQAHFNDFWTRMSQEFQHNADVVAYGLMNEPHDMLSSPNWQTLSQGALNAIRTAEGAGTQERKCIMVPLDGWSGVQSVGSTHPGGPWITDGSGNSFMYEAHHYWDHDHSGDYDWTYQQELAALGGVEGGQSQESDFIADNIEDWI